MANSKPTRPTKDLKVESLDEPLVMTYVIFNDILRFVGSVDEAMTLMLTSQDTRDIVLRRMLSGSEKSIDNTEELVSVADMNIDIFEIDEVLGWVMEHIAYFFMQTANQMQSRMARFPEEAQKMSSSPSQTGTTDSTQSSKSAGPTE